MKDKDKIAPYLWFAEKVEEAARFCASIFPNSSIDRVTTSPAATPSGPPVSVTMVDFTLNGRQFGAMRAGPMDKEEQCGWLKDRCGAYAAAA